MYIYMYMYVTQDSPTLPTWRASHRVAGFLTSVTGLVTCLLGGSLLDLMPQQHVLKVERRARTNAHTNAVTNSNQYTRSFADTNGNTTSYRNKSCMFC